MFENLDGWTCSLDVIVTCDCLAVLRIHGGVSMERIHGWIDTLELWLGCPGLEHGTGGSCVEHVVGEGWNRMLENCGGRFSLSIYLFHYAPLVLLYINSKFSIVKKIRH